MLIPFAHYLRRHTAGVFIAVAILDALLLLGLATKTALSAGELAFAVAAIVGGVSYASLRDLTGMLAYAGQSPKFYRDEADFAQLTGYASGWRNKLAASAGPLPSAIVLAGGFTALNAGCSALWPGLWPATALLLLIYPFTLSRLSRFLAPLLVGWKEVQAHIVRQDAASASAPPIAQRIRMIAAQDLAVTLLLTAALALPVHHSPGFAPALGYGSLDFILAALILVMIVLPLTLLSAWRPRAETCAGELPSTDHGSRWRRWCRYSLLLCALTIVTCLALGALTPALPIRVTLALLLLPLAPVFWMERTRTLSESFRDAAQLLAQFPPSSLNAERLLELAKAA